MPGAYWWFIFLHNSPHVALEFEFCFASFFLLLGGKTQKHITLGYNIASETYDYDTRHSHVQRSTVTLDVFLFRVLRVIGPCQVNSRDFVLLLCLVCDISKKNPES